MFYGKIKMYLDNSINKKILLKIRIRCKICRILKSENNFESVILQFAAITRTNDQTLLWHVTDENILLES